MDETCPIERDTIIEQMIADNVFMRPGYPSMSLMPNFERRHPVNNSERYHRNGIVFPTAMNTCEKDVIYVCKKLKK